MRTFDNYPVGVANDPNAPYNEQLTKYTTVNAEVELSILTNIELEVEADEDGNPDDLQQSLSDYIKKQLPKNTYLNDLYVWDYKLK